EPRPRQHEQIVPERLQRYVGRHGYYLERHRGGRYGARESGKIVGAAQRTAGRPLRGCLTLPTPQNSRGEKSCERAWTTARGAGDGFGRRTTPHRETENPAGTRVVRRRPACPLVSGEGMDERAAILEGPAISSSPPGARRAAHRRRRSPA